MTWTIVIILCWVIALLFAVGDLSKRLSKLEAQNSRQLDILIAIAERNGLDPVTLD